MKKYFIVVLLIISFAVSDVSYASSKDVLIVGDSRIYGMSLYIKDVTSRNYVLAEGGAGIPWLVHLNKGSLGSVMPNSITNNLTNIKSGSVKLSKEIKKKHIRSVVLCLGVNGISSTNFNNYVKYIKWLKKHNKGVNFYVTTLLPVTSRCHSVSGSQVNWWNNMVKKKAKSTGYSVIDSYKTVISIRGYSSYTSDGLHYGTTVYTKVYKGIRKAVK